MSERARLTMTSRDFDALEALLDSLTAVQFPGKSALEAELARAEIVDAAEVAPDVVTMNSTVRFRIEESGEEFRRRLVYPQDDAEQDVISILAPVGSALLGLSVGAELAWPLQGGRVTTVKVVEVSQQPERGEAGH